MHSFRLLALSWLFAVALSGARSADGGGLPPSAAAETIIADPAHDPQWSALFKHLATPKARVSQFEERRHFPFREKPVVLTGEIRILPGHGLSLSYLQPKPQILIVDASGILMRDDRGRQRAAPADSRAQAATSALFQILQFDLAALHENFTVHGARDGATWTLSFVPRDASLGSLIGTVVVKGHEQQLDHIDLTKADNQRIEIILKQTMEDVIFQDDVVKRYFR